MNDASKTKKQLLDEISELRAQLAQVKQADRKTEDRFQGLFEHALNGYAIHRIVTDADNQPVDYVFLDVNPTFEELTGLSREQILDKRVTEVLPDLEPIWIERYGNVALTGEPVRFEQYSTSLQKHYDVAAFSPELGLFVTVFSDISQAKQAEMDAIRERNRAQQYMDVAGVVLVAFDKDGNITMINQKGRTVLGYDEAELIGKNWFDVCLPAAIRENVRQMLRQFVDGEQEAVAYNENPVVTKTGEERIIAWNNITLHDGSGAVVGILGSGEDITERRRMERELRESEERFRLAFEDANTGMCLVGLDGRLMRVNQQMGEIFGYSPEELEGMTVNDIAYPDDLDTSPQFIRKSLAGEIDGGSFEKRYLHKQGQVVHGLVSTSLVRDAQGEPLYFVSQVQDITAQKYAEEAIRNLAKFPEENPNPVLRIGGDGVILYANGASQPLLKENKCAVGDYAPKYWRDLVTEALAARSNRMVDSDCAGRVWSFDVSPVPEGNYVNLYGRDVTRRRQAEHEIRNLAKFPSENPNPVLRISGDGVILYANEASKVLLDEWQCSMGDAVPAFWRDLVAEVIAAGTNREVDTPYGGNVWSFAVSPVLDGEEYVNLYGRDITKRELAEENLRKTNRAYRTLSECNQILVRATEEAALLNDICQAIVKFGGYHMVWVGFPEDDERKTVRPVADAGHETGYLATADITWDENVPSGRGPTGTAIRTGESCSARHIDTDPNFEVWREKALERGYASSIALPMIMDDRVVGALNIYAAEPDAFDDVETHLLVELAGDLAFGVKALRGHVEREQMVEALRKSEERYRQLFETVTDTIFAVDPETMTFVDVNSYGLHQYGYTKEEFLKLHVRAISAESEKTEATIKAQMVEEIDKVRLRYHRKKDGTVFPVEIALSVMELEGRKVAVGIVRDITERKRAEEDLIAAETRYRRLFEAAKDGILILDASTGQVVDANPFLLDLLGYSREDILGKELWEVGLFQDITASQAAFLRLRDEGYIRYEDLPLETPDGRVIDVEFVSNVYLVNGQKVIQCNIRDITDRKRAEKALNERTRALQAVHDVAVDIGSELDTDTLLRRVLERAVDLLNADMGGNIYLYDAEHDVLVMEYGLGEHEQAYVGDILQPGEGLAGHVFQMKKPIAVEEYLKWEGRTSTPDDFPFTAMLSVPLLRDERVIGVLGVNADRKRHTFTERDIWLAERFAALATVAIKNAQLYTAAQQEIAERIQAEEALRASEEKYRHMFMSNPVPMFVFDAETLVFLDVNDFAIDRYGYSRDEFLSMTIEDIRPLEDVAHLHSVLDRERGALKRAGVARHRKKDGTIILVDVAGHTIDFEGRPAVLVMSIDITEREKAEQALRNSEAFLNNVIEQSPNSIWISDDKGTMLRMNQACRDVLNIEDEEVVGKYNVLQDDIVQRQGLMPLVESVFSQGKMVRFDLEYDSSQLEHLQLKRTARLILSVTIFPIKDMTGKITNAVVQHLNITERKQAEQALQRQNEFLLSLQETTLDLISQLDLDQLLENIVRRAGQIMGTSAGMLDLVDLKTNQLIPKVGVGVLAESLNYPVQPGEGLTGTVWQTGQPLVIDDYDSWSNRIGKFSTGALGAMMGVPLLSGSQVLGVLGLAYDKSDATHKTFGPEAVEFLNQFARLATIAIENAQLYAHIQRELVERQRAEESEREQRTLAEALRDTAAALSGTLDPDEVMERVLANVGRVAPHDTADIQIVDSDGFARIIAYRGYEDFGLSEEALSDMRLSVTALDTLSHMAETRQPIIVSDVEKYPGWVDLPETRWVKSYIGAPIFVKDDLIGFINLDSATPGFFNAVHATNLQAFANQAAIAIRNAQLYADVQRELTERERAEAAERDQRTLAEALRDTAAALSSTLDPNEVMERVLENVGRVVPHDAADIQLMDSEGFARIIACRGYEAYGFSKESMYNVRLSVATLDALRQMIETRQPIIVAETDKSPDWITFPESAWIKSYVGAPIFVKDEHIGFINLDSATPRFFNAVHAAKLQAFAGQAGVAIQNARLYQELESHSENLEKAVDARTAELRQVNERLQATLSSSPDAVLLLHDDGTIDSGNPAFYRLFGYKNEEIDQQNVLSLSDPGHAQMWRETLLGALGQCQVQRFETVALRQDGTSFDADVAFAPIVLGETTTGIVCTIRDITDHKRAQEGLQDALDKEHDLLELKSRFTSMVSHEFRNPLAAIQLSASTLQMYADRFDAVRRNRKLESIIEQSQRMTEMLEDVLTIGKLEASKGTYQPVLQDLHEFCRDAFNEIKGTLGQKHQMVFNCNTDTIVTQFDSKLMRQAVNNLLSNAIKYSPEGSTIRFELAANRETIMLGVADTGIGIPEADQRHLFETFHRARNVGAVQGTGLGLAIVRRAIELHEGDITFESKEGVGTTFTVTLPYRRSGED